MAADQSRYTADANGRIEPSTFTAEESSSVMRLYHRVGAGLAELMPERSMDAATVCMVAVMKFADRFGLRMDHVEEFAGATWDLRKSVPRLPGFDPPRGCLDDFGAPDAIQLQALNLVIGLTITTSREEGAGDLVQLMGGLLGVAANLCRDSLTMTRARFVHAPRLAWAWDERWPSAIEVVEKGQHDT